MNYLNKIVLFFALMSFGVLYAQNSASLSGKIVDSTTSEGIIGVAIVADSTTIGAVTDEEGNFTIRGVEKGKSYKFIYSFIGFKQGELLHTIASESDILLEPLVLSEEGVELEEVVVVGSAPTAEQLGDTTQYNAGAYKTNPDATAADLLAKMPGFQSTDGSVEAVGEVITRIYVDGRPFFKDDPAAALSALPADIIESIQLFEEESDRSKFTGGSDGNGKKTINIVTKAKNSDLYMFDVTAGYGTNNRYTSRASANIFKGNNRFSVTAGSNNINQAASNGGTSRFYAQPNKTGVEQMSSARLNYSGEFKEDKTRYTEIGVNYVFIQTKNNTDVLSNQQSTVSDYTINNSSQTETEIDKHSIFIDFAKSMGEKNKITFRPNGSIVTTRNHYDRYSVKRRNGSVQYVSSSDTDRKLSSYNGSLSFSWMHRFNEKNSIVVSSSARLSESQNDQIIEGKISTYESDLGALADSIVNNQSLIGTGNNRVKGSLDYVYRIKNSHTLSFSYDAEYNWSSSDKKNYLFSEIEQAYVDINEAVSNVFNRDYITQGAGMGYAFSVYNKMKLSANVSFQNAAIQNVMSYPRNDEFNSEFNSVLANLKLTVPFSRSKRLTFSYRSRPILPSVTQLQDVVNSNNPMRITKGNSDLTQVYNNTLSFNYVDNNNKKSTSLRAYAVCSNYMNSIVNNLFLIERDTIISGVNVTSGAELKMPINGGTEWNISSGVDYSFPLDFISCKMNTTLLHRYRNSPIYYEKKLTETVNHLAGFDFSIASNITENIDFVVGNNVRFSHTSGNTYSYYLKESANFRCNWIFLNNFVLNGAYSYNYNLFSSVESGNAPNYHLLNAGLGYKFLYKNAAEFRVSGFDLLNQNQSYNEGVSDEFITTSNSMILQRYVLLTFSYRFNSMTKKRRDAAAKKKELKNLLLGK